MTRPARSAAAGDSGTAGDSALARNAIGFVRVLRSGGLTVSTGQAADFLRALEWIDVGVRGQVYHAARAVLVSRHEDLAVFDRAFDGFWSADGGSRQPGPRKAPVVPRHDPSSHTRLTLAMFMASRAGEGDPPVDIADRSEAYSPIEVIGRKHFDRMTSEELARVQELIAGMRWSVTHRRTRRWEPDRRGPSYDLRRSLRDASRHGGVPLHIRRRRRKVKDRPVVVIADVSGSMEQVSRLVLQFFYALSRSLKDVESFVFGTRLTRITPQLRHRSLDRAVEEASREVVDWGGGTRIGDSLRTFNRSWSRRTLRRGAVVVIVSDGCDLGEAELLARELRFIRHRCHRLIWLNPLIGGRGYRPLVAGMAAALQHVDLFMPIHDLQSLHQLAGALSSMSPRRMRRRSVESNSLEVRPS